MRLTSYCVVVHNLPSHDPRLTKGVVFKRENFSGYDETKSCSTLLIVFSSLLVAKKVEQPAKWLRSWCILVCDWAMKLLMCGKLIFIAKFCILIKKSVFIIFKEKRKNHDKKLFLVLMKRKVVPLRKFLK